MSQDLSLLTRSQLYNLQEQTGILYLDKKTQSVKVDDGRLRSLFSPSPSPDSQIRALRLVQDSMRREFGVDPNLPPDKPISCGDLKAAIRRSGCEPSKAPVPAPPDGPRMAKIASDIHEVDGLHQIVAGAMYSQCLLESNFYPFALFHAHPSSFYPTTTAIRLLEPRVRAQLELIPPGQRRDVALFTLAQAVDIAQYCETLQEDKWKPEFAQAVALEKLHLRAAGISAKLAALPSMHGSKEEFSCQDTNPLMALRGKDSVTDDFFRYVDENGGSARMLRFFGMAQKLSSLNPICRAYTCLLLEARPDEQERDGRLLPPNQDINECYTVFRSMTPQDWLAMPIDALTPTLVGFPRIKEKQQNAPPQPCFEKTFHMWLAMQHELFTNLSLPGSDHARGCLHLYRTDNPGRRVSLTQYRRCPVESGSFLNAIQASSGSTAVTEQDVPFHRIMGSCLLGGGTQKSLVGADEVKGRQAVTSILTTDSMFEVMFRTDKIPCTTQ